MDETVIGLVANQVGLSPEKVSEYLTQYAVEQGLQMDAGDPSHFRRLLAHLLQELTQDIADGKNPFIRLLD